MEYIAHRVNTIEQLLETPKAFGVELDVRDSLEGRLYLQHEPFIPGEDFEEYLKRYRHGTMIVNVKSERVEYEARALLQKYGIERFFFLDSSFPMIKALCDEGETRIALRYSEYEGLDTIRNMAGKAGWVWVDCFSQMPLNRSDYLELKGLGYRLCLVSPDLVGRGQEIESYKRLIEEREIHFDAICAKRYNANRWLDKE